MATTIVLKDETKERLAKHGKFGESFDELLNRLMDTLDKQEIVEQG